LRVSNLLVKNTNKGKFSGLHVIVKAQGQEAGDFAKKVNQQHVNCKQIRW
jgi:putative lipoic acid-binding regulatory protein